jgi:hypothetical protein
MCRSEDHGPARAVAREPVPQARPRARGNQYEETEADREAAWLERELYEQDSARWELEDA